MTISQWNVDEFSSELKAEMVTALAGVPEFSGVAAALTGCAAAAEAVCTGRTMACGAGCPHCCVLNVAVLLPEAMVIAEWMRERMSQPELEVMEKRLALHRCWTRWMDDDERITKHMTCPFLDEEGSCIIHPVRPLACRGVASLDSNSCREALSPVVTDEARLVVADLLRRAAFDTAFTALARALKSHGLDDRSIELGAGVMAFLENPRRREEFLSGAKLPRDLWL